MEKVKHTCNYCGLPVLSSSWTPPRFCQHCNMSEFSATRVNTPDYYDPKQKWDKPEPTQEDYDEYYY